MMRPGNQPVAISTHDEIVRSFHNSMEQLRHSVHFAHDEYQFGLEKELNEHIRRMQFIIRAWSNAQAAAGIDRLHAYAKSLE